MCLVDTLIGVASGEALFLYRTFALDCGGNIHLNSGPREVKRRLLKTIVPIIFFPVISEV